MRGFFVGFLSVSLMVVLGCNSPTKMADQSYPDGFPQSTAEMFSSFESLSEMKTDTIVSDTILPSGIGVKFGKTADKITHVELFIGSSTTPFYYKDDSFGVVVLVSGDLIEVWFSKASDYGLSWLSKFDIFSKSNLVDQGFSTTTLKTEVKQSDNYVFLKTRTMPYIRSVGEVNPLTETARVYGRENGSLITYPDSTYCVDRNSVKVECR